MHQGLQDVLQWRVLENQIFAFLVILTIRKWMNFIFNEVQDCVNKTVNLFASYTVYAC